jgi:hypothetical protein
MEKKMTNDINDIEKFLTEEGTSMVGGRITEIEKKQGEDILINDALKMEENSSLKELVEDSNKKKLFTGNNPVSVFKPLENADSIGNSDNEIISPEFLSLLNEQEKNKVLTASNEETKINNKISIKENNEDLKNITKNARKASVIDVINIATNKTNSIYPKFKVSLLTSGYSVLLEAFNYADNASLATETTDSYTKMKNLYKSIYNKICEWSCTPMSFPEFLENTAYSDLDTLEYGVYSATYPGSSEFEINCSECNFNNKINITPNQLIQKPSEETFGAMRDQLRKEWDNKGTGVPLSGFLQEEKYIRLPDSKMIVVLQLTSLQNFLSTTQKIHELFSSRKGIKENGGKEIIASTCSSIKNIFVEVSPENSVEVNAFSDIFDIIKAATTNDSTFLTKNVRDLNKNIRLDYTIPSFKCVSCNKLNDENKMNFENALFFKSGEIRE